MACAAILLESGVKKEAVVEFMAGMSEFPVEEHPRKKRPTYAIQRAFEPKVIPAEALMADGMNLRFKFAHADTGWRQPGTFAPLASAYRPRVVISIDLAQLRDLFLAGR